MTGKQLKNSILQWAIQGKLVPQDPTDEPASVLLEKIRQEKERLIKEKKIKRDKNASIIYRGEDNSYYEKILATGEVKCIDEEIPFEIPKGWEWCRVTDVMKKITDGTHNSPTNTNKGEYMYITAKNIKENGISLANITFVSKNIHDEIYSRCNPEYGDLLYIKDGATTGIVTINNIEEPYSLLSSVALLKPTSKVNTNYLLYFLRTPLNVESVRGSMKGCSITRITLRQIEKWLIPIPPLQEQQRIVTLINELLPYLDKYGTLQNKLNSLNVKINNKLRNSIIQEAIQGKLVPQIAEEGTAQELLEQIQEEKQRLVNEGKLKKSALATSTIFRGDDNKYYEQIGSEVTEIELPFDFPSTWSIARLNAVCQLTDGLKTTGNQCLLDAKYLRGKSSETIVEQGKLVYKGDNIMLVDGENSGEVFIVPQDGYMGSTFKQLWISSSMYEPYVLAFIQFYKETLRNSKKGAAIPHLNKELFYGLIIGIPPLQEQRRLVRKIEQSMQLLK